MNFKDILTDKRLWIVVALLVAALVVLPKIFKGIKEHKDLNQKTSNKVEKYFKTKYGLEATISKNRAKQLADSMESAMSGLGTNKSMLNDIFSEIKNSLDLLYIYKQFGIRQGEDLTGWLNGEWSLKIGLTARMKEMMKDKKNFPISLTVAANLAELIEKEK